MPQKLRWCTPRCAPGSSLDIWAKVLKTSAEHASSVLRAMRASRLVICLAALAALTLPLSAGAADGSSGQTTGAAKTTGVWAESDPGSSPGKVSSDTQAPPAGGGLEGSFGNPTCCEYLEFKITGADLKPKAGSVQTPETKSYEGTSTSSTITLTGRMSVTRDTAVSSVNSYAWIGDQSWKWPPAGQSGDVSGRTVSETFSLTYKVGSASYGQTINGSVELNWCGGICVGYKATFAIKLQKPAAPPTAPKPTTPKPKPSPKPNPKPKPKAPPATVDTSPPVVQTLKPAGIYEPGEPIVMQMTVKDDSGKATPHGTLYDGGAPVRSAGGTSMPATGQILDWKTMLGADLQGPLYFCVWAQDAAGNRSTRTPCEWISLLVDIASVSNGCGGSGWGYYALQVQNYFGNTETYNERHWVSKPKPGHWEGEGGPYTVNFVAACNLHDAGYGGHMVKDEINGGPPVDFRTWSREKVDTKFRKDMEKLCVAAIPAEKTHALIECRYNWRHHFVRKYGSHFYDANPRMPGTQGGDRRPGSTP